MESKEYRVYDTVTKKYYSLGDIVLAPQRDGRKKKREYHIAIGYATGIGLQPMLYSFPTDVFFWRGAELVDQPLERIPENTKSQSGEREEDLGDKIENIIVDIFRESRDLFFDPNELSAEDFLMQIVNKFRPEILELLSESKKEWRLEMKNEILELEDIDVNQEGDMEKKGYVLISAIRSLVG